ncbi:hypothetical protein BKA67DRAFT_658081 [Truncatella angustata]|uniref:Uncharacterized protein n=1 Tax=Truncatella angustata TaxID=152316 RepID=A0A9P8UKE7_9PEZI|nr:uncharacterized protein BKA67DRAFT_658081 [Truncatella angustata]KAH6653738.1 hypothetical protein BKA67DRAFT_658081 [Truncatella angustata]
MNTPLNHSPSIEDLKAVIIRALPDVSIESIQPPPTTRPQRDVHIRISGSRTLMLTIPPHQMLRLLRSEQWLVLSEALIIPWMCRRALEYTTKDKRTSISYLIETEPSHDIATSPTNSEKDLRRVETSEGSLIRYLPALISHSPASEQLGTAYNLTEPPRGVPITSLPVPLSEAERSRVEYQKGQFIRCISNLKEPGSKFGLVVSVLGPQSSSSADSSAAAAIVGSGGVNSWSNAFLALVEGTLRDGEDRAVTISYSSIRHHMHRLSHLLDAVTQSRLVVLDAGSDLNVLVSGSRQKEDQKDTQPLSTGATQGTLSHTNIAKQDSLGDETKEPGSKYIKTKNPDRRRTGSPGGGSETKQSYDFPGMSVTGLRDWSNCIFGDPLMTSIFSEDPSPEFIRGFRQQPPSSTTSSASTTSTPRLSSPPTDEIIEDRENAAVRILMYECYHATVCLVKQFYRPARADSSKREVEARRRLATVLNKLAEVDENATKRHRTASADIWPVKKPKARTEAQDSE